MSDTLLKQNPKVSSLDLSLYVLSQRETVPQKKKKSIFEKQNLDSVSSLLCGKTESAVLLPWLTCFLPLLSCRTKHSETGEKSKAVPNAHPVKRRREMTCFVNHYHLHAAINNIEHLCRGAKYPFMPLTWCTDSLDSQIQSIICDE